MRQRPLAATATLWWMLAVAGPAAADITATTAADVCPAAANPCVVSQTVNVQPGSKLDFGTRTVEVTNSGQFNFGSSNGQILCGNFQASGGSTAIKAVSQGIGGVVTLTARGACSNAPAIACLTDATCASANAGACLSTSVGSVSLGGKITGNGSDPAVIVVRALGDLTVSEVINVSATLDDSDGGELELESLRGDLIIQKKIQATGGLLSSGGDVELSAGGDVKILATVDVSGGDFDGGFLTVDAGRDLAISSDVLAGSTGGGGYGGEIGMSAGGDITMTGGTSLQNLVINTTGHMSSDAFGGDGGEQDYTAGGTISVGPFVRLTADGAPPDGFGELIALDAGLDVLLQGKIQSRGTGSDGGGGFFDVFTGGEVTTTAGSSVDLSGGGSGGGELTITAGAAVTQAGSWAFGASSSGIGGDASVEADGDVTVAGSISNGGLGGLGATGEISIQGCRVTIQGGAVVANGVPGARNIFIARERFSLLSGAQVTGTGSGSNQIVFRDAAKPPILSGVMTPAPTVVQDPGLASCPICGDAVVDPGETCDDGNTLGGDGCSNKCQDEGCIQDTPGYPAVALCDDAGACSQDVCNTTSHRCDHIVPCDDAIDCTVGTCDGAQCLNVPDDSRCDDGNDCTEDTCVDGVGCVHAILSSGPCDDGVFCNGPDTCDNGACTIHSGDPCPGIGGECGGVCDEASDRCFAPAGTPCSSDGQPCTDDICDGAGGCIHPNNISPCNDGVFCNGNDTCVAGVCSFHMGNPCSGGPICANLCNETLDSCFRPAGSSCVDDQNVCTDDVCDGTGSCVHTANSAPCEDKDFCTVDDQCMNGACGAGAGPALTRGVLKARQKDGDSNDQLSFRAELDLADLTAVPTATGMYFIVLDSSGNQVYESTIPAARIEDKGGKGTIFRFRDKAGEVTSANGVQSLLLKLIPKKGVGKLKLKQKGAEVPGLSGQIRTSVAALFGAQPGVDECFSGRNLFCAGNASKHLCRTP